MQYTNDALSSSFQLLNSIVRDLHANGRRRLGAAVKLALRHRTNYTFNEQLLGFPRFGDFLRAAERAGFVKLTPTPGGDIEVWPAGIQPPQAALFPEPTQTAMHQLKELASNLTASKQFNFPAPIRIRQDLWNAFNSYSATWIYDRAHDIAFRKNPSLDAGSDMAAPLGPEMVPVPAGRARVIEWMRTFAGTQNEDVKQRLFSSLDGDAATYNFTNSVANDVSLRRAWRRFHIQQVLKAIETWAASNNLQPKDVSSSFSPIQRKYWGLSQPTVAESPTEAPPPPPSTPQVAQQSLTPRLAALIDELIDELLRLRGTLQTMESKR